MRFEDCSWRFQDLDFLGERRTYRKNISYGVRIVFVYVAIRVKDRILQKLELGNLWGGNKWEE